MRFNNLSLSSILKSLLVKSKLPLLFLRNQKSQIYIFNYHRVREHVDSLTNFDDGCFSLDAVAFRQQVKFFSENFCLISEEELIKHINNETRLSPKKNYAMITFDDGYIDNFKVALPILKEFKAPATFFIPTKMMTERNLGWWDLVAFFLKHRKKNAFEFNFKKYDLEVLSKEACAEEICALLKKSSPAEVNTLLFELQQATESKWPTKEDQSEELMTWQQLKESKEFGVSIGSHSHSHYVLAHMSIDEQRSELKKSKEILERNLGFEIKSFAYPVGRYTDFNLETKKILDECGYKVGYSFMTGSANTNELDRFDVKRVYAPADIESILLGCAFPQIFFRNKSAIAQPLSRLSYATR
jgi:peptidoglycan/xylan/chitin deacetylase (PgdA/CDA1 family)